MNESIREWIEKDNAATAAAARTNGSDEGPGRWENLLQVRRAGFETRCNVLRRLDGDIILPEEEKSVDIFRASFAFHLCSVGKCYIGLRRMAEGKEFLQQGVDLINQYSLPTAGGPMVLLAICSGSCVKSAEDLLTIQTLFYNADPLAPDVSAEINNTTMQVSATFLLASLARYTGDIKAAHMYLEKLTENTHVSERVHEMARAELTHYVQKDSGEMVYVKD